MQVMAEMAKGIRVHSGLDLYFLIIAYLPLTMETENIMHHLIKRET